MKKCFLFVATSGCLSYILAQGYRENATRGKNCKTFLRPYFIEQHVLDTNAGKQLS